MSARDFDARSHGLWRMRMAQWGKRWKYFAGIIVGCAAACILLAMQYFVPPGASAATLQYGLANFLVWSGDGSGHAISMNASMGGPARKVPALWVAEHDWFRSAWVFVRDA